MEVVGGGPITTIAANAASQTTGNHAAGMMVTIGAGNTTTLYKTFDYGVTLSAGSAVDVVYYISPNPIGQSWVSCGSVTLTSGVTYLLVPTPGYSGAISATGFAASSTCTAGGVATQ